MKEMFAREDAMFQELAPILTEQQMPQLSRVQMHRQRSRCMRWSVIPGARIDLTALVEKTKLPEEVIEALEPTLHEYETAVTPVMVKIQRVEDRQMLDGARLEVELDFEADGTKVDPQAPGFKERFGAWQEQREKLLRNSARLQKQVAEINRQFGPRLLELIPEPRRKPVETEYLYLAHPFFCPDHCDPKPLFDAIMQSKGLDPKLREVFQATWDTYRESYDLLTHEMIEATDRSDEQMARTLTGFSGSSLPEWKLRAQRWDKSMELVDTVVGQLPPELQASMKPQVTAYKQRVEMLRAMAEHRQLPNQPAPPQPPPK